MDLTYIKHMINIALNVGALSVDGSGKGMIVAKNGTIILSANAMLTKDSAHFFNPSENLLLSCVRYNLDLTGAEVFMTHFPDAYTASILIEMGISLIVFYNDDGIDGNVTERLKNNGITLLQGAP